MFWEEMKRMAERCDGFEGVVYEQLTYIFSLWQSWMNGAKGVNWNDVSNEIDKLKQLLYEYKGE